MPNLQDQFNEAAEKAEKGSKIIYDVANGPATGPNSTVLTDNGPVETVAKKLSSLEAEYNANNIVTVVVQAKLDAEAAADQAELARDQAIAAAVVPTPADANKFRAANATGTADHYVDLPIASETVLGVTKFATGPDIDAAIKNDVAISPAALGSIKAVDQVARNNIALQALLREIDHKASVQSYQDMVSDKFNDPYGIDISMPGGLLSGNNNSGSTHTQATSPWVAQKIAGQVYNPVEKVRLFIPSGGSFVNQDIRIETDNNNAPSGVLVHANAEIVNANGVANAWGEWSFPGLFNLTPGKTYWLVISRNAATNYSIAKASGGQDGLYFNGAYTASAYLAYGILYKEVVGLSTGAFLNLTKQCIHNRSLTMVPQATGVNIGTMTSGGGLASVFNGTNVDATPANGGTAGYGTGTTTVGKNFGAVKTIGMVRFFATSDRGFQNDGSWTSAIQSFTINSGPDINTPTEIAKVVGVDNSKMAARIMDVYVDNFVPGLCCWASITGSYPALAEMQFFEVSAPGMELISKPFPAAYVPAKAALLGLLQAIDPIVLNTDVKFWVTRNDLANWIQVPLAYIGDFDGFSKTAYGEGLLSGPANTQMRWKVTTHNGKELRLNGVGEMWRP